jgi:hypothetical protein
MSPFHKLLWFFVFFIACKSSTSTVIFHTEMGEMTVGVLPGISTAAASRLEILLKSNQDSLAIGKVLHDAYIQINAPVEAVEPSGPFDRPATSGAFVLAGTRFYLIQGRKQTDATLDKWEQTTGRKIPQAFREQYKQLGGALQLEGRCVVLGTLRAGQPVLDRIAALPSDSAGQPLRAVSLRLTSATTSK